jgi:hypothetical protein
MLELHGPFVALTPGVVLGAVIAGEFRDCIP